MNDTPDKLNGLSVSCYNDGHDLCGNKTCKCFCHLKKTHILAQGLTVDVKDEVNYKAVLVFKSLICDNCKTAVVAKDVMICQDEDELLARATNEHRSKGDKMHALCPKPLLFIVYDHALIDTRLLPQQANEDI